MIQELVRFIDYLEVNDSDIFSENLMLKEGLYVFLEKEGDELVASKKIKVDKNTEMNSSYYDFLKLVSNTEMLNAMKSFNSGPKIYIAIGSPFAISISGLGLSKSLTKKLTAADAYFKAARKYISEDNGQHLSWLKDLEIYVKTKMFDFIDSSIEDFKIKKGEMFYFFLREPSLADYQEIQTRFLSEKLFNKDKFNIKTEAGEIFGISDNLSGFNDSKEFLKHKTAPLEYNYRISGQDAMKIYKFFRLQQKNKILPNPFPLFIDEQELSEKAISFYKNDRKLGHKEIVEHLINERKGDLQNYYLIFFHNGQKGSRIVDLDFVPVFKYKTDDMPLIRAWFNVDTKKGDKIFFDNKIENIFHFQSSILNKIFNNQLITETKNGLWLKYFEDMDVKPEYGATDIIVDLFYKYKRSLYDYVYKSKREAIDGNMFNDMMLKSILDDIRHDTDANKSFNISLRIKEKLNIWFSLSKYFNNDKNYIDMINKTEQLFERLKLIAKPENTLEHIKTDEEFAFAAGQIIWKLLIQSESANRTNAMLEPFLQKTDVELFKQAIARTFDMYKHKFKLYPVKYEFDKVMSEVMGITDVDIKKNIPLIMAGYFSASVFSNKDN